MASNLKKSNLSVNASTLALTSLCSNGYLRLYGGVQPSSSDIAVSGQTLLAELRFDSVPFSEPVDGVAVATTIQPELSNKNTGKATWFRIYTENEEPVMDGSVGKTGCDINMNTVNIQADAKTEITAFTLSTLKSGNI